MVAPADASGVQKVDLDVVAAALGREALEGMRRELIGKIASYSAAVKALRESSEREKRPMHWSQEDLAPLERKGHELLAQNSAIEELLARLDAREASDPPVALVRDQAAAPAPRPVYHRIDYLSSSHARPRKAAPRAKSGSEPSRTDVEVSSR